MLEHAWAEPRSPRRVVVLGAGGFVGGAIARRLIAGRVETLPLTRRDVDLLDRESFAKLAGLLRADDALVFVSAKAPAKTVDLVMTNLRMAETVCGALSTRPVAHLVYVSSDAIYADDQNPVTESSYAAPTTLHGVMHGAREAMLRAEAKAPFAALRPTLIYGAGDPHGGYGPNRFRRQAQAGGPILVFGEGEERRDHVLVDDVAALAELILRRRSSGALNAATGRSIPFVDIARTIARQFGGSVRVESQPRPGPRPHLLHRHFDISSCHKAFPEFHYTPIEDGLRRAMQAEAR